VHNIRSVRAKVIGIHPDEHRRGDLGLGIVEDDVASAREDVLLEVLERLHHVENGLKTVLSVSAADKYRLKTHLRDNLIVLVTEHDESGPALLALCEEAGRWVRPCKSLGGNQGREVVGSANPSGHVIEVDILELRRKGTGEFNAGVDSVRGIDGIDHARHERTHKISGNRGDQIHRG
jgi:hypothetical protein